MSAVSQGSLRYFSVLHFMPDCTGYYYIPLATGDMSSFTHLIISKTCQLKCYCGPTGYWLRVPAFLLLFFTVHWFCWIQSKKMLNFPHQKVQLFWSCLQSLALSLQNKFKGYHLHYGFLLNKVSKNLSKHSKKTKSECDGRLRLETDWQIGILNANLLD